MSENNETRHVNIELSSNDFWTGLICLMVIGAILSLVITAFGIAWSIVVFAASMLWDLVGFGRGMAILGRCCTDHHCSIE